MRRATPVLLGTLALVGALSAPANAAVPDPVGTVTCVAETPSGVTELVAPSALLDPAGLPGVGCLAP